MKSYKLPFDWNGNTQLAHKKSIGQMHNATPKGYQKWLEREAYGLTYYLTDAQLSWFKEHGPPKPPVYTYDASENLYPGADCFILCPGPSLKAALPEPKVLDGKLTIAANSAWFYYQPRYWCIAESHYIRWLCKHDSSWHAQYYDRYAAQEFLITARAAIWWWKNGPGRGPNGKRGRCPYKSMYLLRHEECGAVPMPVDGVTAFNAIASAWWMGCKRAILIGLDLSKPGSPYVDGVPYDQHGANASYTPQVFALSQAIYPELEVLNASPHSADKLPFRAIDGAELATIISGTPSVAMSERCR